MPNKKLILVFLAGYALSMLIPPARVIGMVKGKSS